MLSKPMRRLACSSAASQASVPLHTASCRSIHSPATSIFASSAITSPSTSAAARHQDQRQRGHQRRPSSSKASCPPSGNKSPPNEDDKRRLSKGTVNAAEEQQQQQQNDKQAPQRLTTASGRGMTSASSRRSKVGAKDVASATSKDAKDDPFANLNLPIVPPTSHLNLGDVKISSFFSLHRPISVTTSFPPTSPNSDSFNSIFATRSSSSSQKTNDVIYTLSNMTSALEGIVAQHQNGDQSEHDLRWEIAQQQQQQSGPDGQMDGQSLEELVQQFRPFNVPPPPVPFDEARPNRSAEPAGQAQKQQNTEVNESARVSTRKGKTYTSTLTISESTTPSGQRSWTAFASPFVEQNVSASSGRRSTNQVSAVEPRQPFLKRMRARQSSADEYIQEKITTANGMTTIPESAASADGAAIQDGRNMNGRAMLLISVKRQRKLKMKKHKYKKLMRRTRNLRRKEGRL